MKTKLFFPENNVKIYYFNQLKDPKNAGNDEGWVIEAGIRERVARKIPGIQIKWNESWKRTIKENGTGWS